VIPQKHSKRRKTVRDGIYVTAIRPPTVPEDAARIRTTVMSSHADTDIDFAIGIFTKLKQEGFL
jgi:8-amino-7-oxononanoate synthase